MVLTISELSSSEEEDHELDLPVKDANGRSLSLPFITKYKPKKKEKLLETESEAFNQKLFYYIEAFMDQAIQKKIKEIIQFETPQGRLRSSSYAIF